MKNLHLGFGIVLLSISPSVSQAQFDSIPRTFHVHASGQTCDTTFLGGPNDDLMDSIHWSAGLPNATAIACIPDGRTTGRITQATINTSSTQTLPPNTIGACCLGSTCLITDAFDCKIQRGYFRPKTVLCSESVCGTGVCCKNDPSCDDSGGTMTEEFCVGDYIGGASCDGTDPCQRFRIPEGFEIVETALGTEDQARRHPYMNDCGEIVYHMTLKTEFGLHNEVFHYDNGILIPISQIDTRSQIFPDINNFGTMTFGSGLPEQNTSEIVLRAVDGVITSLQLALGPLSPQINILDQAIWDVRISPSCPDPTRDAVYVSNSNNVSLLFDDGLSNQSPTLNDVGDYTWDNIVFECGGAFAFWTADIMLHTNGKFLVLPSAVDTPQISYVDNIGRVAWGSFDLVEVWKNGVTTDFGDGHIPALNDRGDIAYMFKTSTTPWQIILLRNSIKYYISSDFDIPLLIDNARPDINEAGEIVWYWKPNGGFTPSGVRYMRRIRNGDVNFDGVVDVDDFLAMPGCFTGPVDTDRLCQCRFYDMNHDRDVDLDDLDLFLRVYPDPVNDCDSNGTSDFEELLVGTASDCNLNAIPDACEAGDLDGDGMLDSCCLPTTPILSSTGVRNRYLTFKTINQAPFKLPGMGQQGEPVAMHNVNQAIRVTITAAPANPPAGFETLVGKSFWVSSPKTVCENSGQNFNTPIEECAPAAGLLSNTFLMASLQCDPVFASWFELGEVHVQHQMIIPGATYAIELINEGCSLATASNFSAALTVTNSRWGDVVANCSTSPCGPPDGVVNITTDVTAVLEKFKNAPTAPSKSRTDIEPSIPDGKINFTDVTFTLDAFTQQPYPFTPTPLICPG